jgi:hypothetical protein
MMVEVRSPETSVLTRVTQLISQKMAFFVVTAVKTSNLTVFSHSIVWQTYIFEMEECRKLHSKELRELYSSPSIKRMINSKRLGCARHVTRMETGNWKAFRLMMGKPEGIGPLETPKRRCVIRLRWILKKQNMAVWTGLVWIRIETSGGPF